MEQKDLDFEVAKESVRSGAIKIASEYINALGTEKNAHFEDIHNWMKGLHECVQLLYDLEYLEMCIEKSRVMSVIERKKNEGGGHEKAHDPLPVKRGPGRPRKNS